MSMMNDNSVLDAPTNAEASPSTPTVSGGDAPAGGDASGESLVVVDYDTTYEAVYNAVTDALTASQTVTDGQMVNSTALGYFEGILGNQMLPVDYVVYVGEPYTYWSNNYERTAYEYCMAYGELDVDGTHFTGDATIVTLRTSGYVSVDYQYDQAISLYAPLYYSRSNLGDYSGIYAYDWPGLYMVILLITGGLIWFMRKLMCFRY